MILEGWACRYKLLPEGSRQITAFLMPGTLHQNLLWFAIGYSTLYLVYLHMSWQCSQNRLAAA